jgi:hypothetical protein
VVIGVVASACEREVRGSVDRREYIIWGLTNYIGRRQDYRTHIHCVKKTRARIGDAAFKLSWSYAVCGGGGSIMPTSISRWGKGDSGGPRKVV